MPMFKIISAIWDGNRKPAALREHHVMGVRRKGLSAIDAAIDKVTFHPANQSAGRKVWLAGKLTDDMPLATNGEYGPLDSSRVDQLA